MPVPGKNLYRQATQVIARQTYLYYEFTGTTIDTRGRVTNLYAPAVALRDSIQALPRDLYQQIGLDFSKKAIQIFTDSPLFDIRRDYSGDQIEYAGERYQLRSDTNWRNQDGWKEIYAIMLADEVPL